MSLSRPDRNKPTDDTAPSGTDVRFQARLLDAMDQAVIATDPQGKIIYWNRAAERLYGWSAKEAMDHSIIEAIPSQELMDRAEEIMSALRAGRCWSGEFVVRRMNGTSFPTILAATPVHDEQGNLVAIICVSTDITELKKTEQLRHSEERFRSFVQNVAGVILVMQADGTVRYISSTVERILGYKTEEVVGKDTFSIVHSDDMARVENVTANAVRNPGATFSMELRLRHKDGSWRHVESSFTTLLENPAVGDIVINSWEITERKRTEEALRESEKRFRRTFEDAPIGIAFVGLDGRRFRCNRALCEMLGCSEEDLLGENYLEHVHPDDRLISTEHFQRTLEEEAGSYELERRYLRTDGHVVWHLTSVSLIRDSEGDPSYFVCLHQDITERRQVEERLKRSEIGLAAAQERAHLGSWEWDIATDELRWSDEHYRIFGYTPQSFTPSYETHYLDAVHPEDRERVEQAINEAFEGKPYNIDYRIVRPDEEVRHVDSYGEILFDDEGGGEEPVGMAGTIQDITERKLTNERLHHQAFYDLLTDLPNRQLFIDRLKQALRHTKRRPGRKKVAVLFMDLDNFKDVNDSLGHEVGDRLLVAVGERLRRCLRPEDTLARFGGDEFTALVEDIENPEGAVRVAKRLIEAFQEPFVLESRKLFIKPSIGIVLGTARTTSSDELLRDADAAMYQAKEEGLEYRVFEPVMYEQVLSRLKLENELQHAIEAEEFVVHYQPIINLRSDEVWGVEALVRWRHPERGLLDPKEFITLAEESGLVASIGEQVLNEACKQAKEWKERASRVPPLVMVVNLSARQLERPDLVRTVEGMLRENGLDGHCLCLDITETVYVKVLEGNTAALNELKRLGVRISIDDFGTGYASLAYLKRLPADILKVDKSFIEGLGEDVEDTLVVQMIVDLAHAFGMEVIAEGVESEVQAEQLKEMGCDLVQGFYFTEPLPSEAVTEFLAG